LGVGLVTILTVGFLFYEQYDDDDDHILKYNSLTTSFLFQHRYTVGCVHDDSLDCIQGEKWRLNAWLCMGIPINLMLVVIAYYMYMIYLHVKTVVEAAQSEIEKTASMSVDVGAKKQEARNRPDSSQLSKVQDRVKDNRPTEEDDHFHELEKEDDDDVTMRKARVNQYLPNMIVEEEQEQKNQSSSFKAPNSKVSFVRNSFQARHQSQQQSYTDKQDSPVELTGALKESYNKLESRIQETAIQAYWYIGIYVIAHAWNRAWSICEQVGWTPPFWLLFLCSFFWPSQGFWNIFVFLRPRIATVRNRYPDVSYWVAVYWSIFYLDDRTLKLRTAELPQASRARLSRMSLSKERAAAAAAAAVPPPPVNQHNDIFKDIKNSNTVESTAGKSTTSRRRDLSDH
jgi:hypothetical protein